MAIDGWQAREFWWIANKELLFSNVVVSVVLPWLPARSDMLPKLAAAIVEMQRTPTVDLLNTVSLCVCVCVCLWGKTEHLKKRSENRVITVGPAVGSAGNYMQESSG